MLRRGLITYIIMIVTLALGAGAIFLAGWIWIGCMLIASSLLLNAVCTALWTGNPPQQRSNDWCKHCKYNLNGLPLGSKCPECGKATQLPS